MKLFADVSESIENACHYIKHNCIERSWEMENVVQQG